MSELLLDKELGAIGEHWGAYLLPRMSVLLEVYVPVFCRMVALSFSMLWMILGPVRKHYNPGNHQ